MSGMVANRMARDSNPWRITPTPALVGFAIYVFVIMTYRLPIGTLAMVAALTGLVLQREAVRTPRFVLLFAAWMVWAVLGYAVTPYPDVVFESLVEHGKILLVTLVAVNVLRTGTHIRYFMLLMLIGFLLFPARATLVNYFVIGHTLAGRAIGPFIYANPNDLAALTILMLGPALALWASAARGSWVRWVGLAGAAPLVVVIVLTQSRGAFLALAVMTLPSAIALGRRRPWTALAFAAVLGLALYLAPHAFWDRMAGLRKATRLETIGEMDPEGSARERFAVLQTAVRIIEDHPLLGVGLGAYEHANADYNPTLGRVDAHNTYVHIFAENGLPGLLLFLAIVTSVVRGAQAVRRRARRALPAQAEMLRWLQYGLIGHLVAGLFGSVASFVLPYILLALLWGASQVVRAQCPPTSAPQRPTGKPDYTAMPIRRHPFSGV